MESRHFFDMKSFLPATYPTGLTVMTAVKNGREKRISRSNTDPVKTVEPPLDLWSIEMSLRGVISGIKWEKWPSGIRGVTKRNSRPAAGVTIAIIPGEMDNAAALSSLPIAKTVCIPASDTNGRFEVPLAPGWYRIVAYFRKRNGDKLEPRLQNVVVKENAYTNVAVVARDSQ